MTARTELADRGASTQPESRPPDLRGTGWVRVTAVGGLVFFGLFIAFASLTTNTPAASDTGREVFRYLSLHHDRLQLAAGLYALAMPAALLFWSGLFAELRYAEGSRSRIAVAALAGAVLAAAATVTGALLLGVTGTRWLDLGPSGSRVFWTMFLLSIGAMLAGQVLAIGATSAVCLRNPGVLPRWLALASVVLAVASLVGAFTVGYTAAGIQAVAGGAAVLDSVWILLVSYYLWRRPAVAGR